MGAGTLGPVPPVGRVGEAPRRPVADSCRAGRESLYVYIEDDRGGGSGGFFIYWSGSSRFDSDRLFVDWAQNAETLDGWDLDEFDWRPDSGVPSGLAQPFVQTLRARAFNGPKGQR